MYMEIIQFVLICIWLLSLIIMCLRFIHVVMYSRVEVQLSNPAPTQLNS